MEGKLTLNDSIDLGKNKVVSVMELANDKTELFKYIKKGFWFDDDVLSNAGIKRTIRNERIENVFVDRVVEKKKTYPKDTSSLQNILKSLHTIQNGTVDDDEYVKTNNDNNYASDDDEE